MSSFGGLRYLFNMSYGIGKEACDRMAADGGLQLKKHNVAFVSLWPAFVATEFITESLRNAKPHVRDPFTTEHGAETTEYAGKAVAFLAADPNIMKKSGRILLTSDLGAEFGFVDVNGKTPTDGRSLKMLLVNYGYRRTAWFIPAWIKIPRWVVYLSGYKF
jgi:dehydrogenase/reductase SDR family protein 1